MLSNNTHFKLNNVMTTVTIITIKTIMTDDDNDLNATVLPGITGMVPSHILDPQ